MTPGPRPVFVLALPAIAGALLMLAEPAGAQQEAPKSDGMERAQKAADAVFHWIKLHADKPAPRPQPAPAPAPAPKKPAPVAAAPKPAPAPAPALAASSAPTPASTPTAVAAAAASVPVPVPVPVAARPEPAPEPVVLAAAEPTPAPAAPMTVAAQAAEPPPAPEQQDPEEPLRLLSKVDPTMPRQLQQTSFRNGFAQVQFTVAADGSVQQAAVIKASHSRLGSAAVEAVRQWRFAPLSKAREAAVEIAFKNEGD
ncbi:energy transducer TonB [Roseateles sp.]|uniref:energy transducer TonB n=1 Tax=Roseateles sp. TaxID=1971397 RepID=UPI0039EA03AB